MLLRTWSASALICAIGLVAGPALAGKKEPVWETAKVISQQFHSEAAGTYAAPLGNGTVAVPIYRNWNRTVVETGPYQYEWQQVDANRIIFVVNDTIRFYRDGSWFIVLDNRGKKHKFALVGALKIE